MTNPQNGPNHIRRATIIWAVATAISLAVFLVIAPSLESWGILPPVAAVRTGEINEVMAIFTILSIPVFTLVVVFAGYSVFQFRVRGRPTGDGPQMRGNQRIQYIWIGVSIVLVAFLFGYGLHFLNEVDAAPTGNVVQVHVTGEQWLWNYSYPQYGNVSGTTLYLPVGHPVEFTITSVDVQHSFWIPALGIKEDAVPGETTHISVTPNLIGDYVVRCAELCGAYHAYMETPVHVVSDTYFANWVAQQQSAQSPTGLFSGGGLPQAALTGVGSRRSFAS